MPLIKIHIRLKCPLGSTPPFGELLSNLVFESFWSCGDLAFWGGFNSVFERDACDDFGEVVKAA
jgi:hypothetical protein